MLGLDQQKQTQWARKQAEEQFREMRARALADDLKSNEVTVEADNGTDITNAIAQMGKPLSAETVIEKLKKCNSRLYFERAKSDPSLYGIYLQDPTGTVYVNPQGEVLILKHICGMEAGIMPEFTVIHKVKKKIANPDILGKDAGRDVPWKVVDTYGGQTRGWRTVLVRLLHAGLITRGDVEKHFGWAPSRDSQRWNAQTS
jgi:hypothetical protein